MPLPTHDAIAGLCPDDNSTVTFEWDETGEDGNGLVTGVPGGIYVGTCPHCHRRIVRERGPIVTTIGGGPSPIESAVESILARREAGIVASPDNAPKGDTYTLDADGNFRDKDGNIAGVATDAGYSPNADIDQTAPDVPAQITASDEEPLQVFPPTDVRESIATEPTSSVPGEVITGEGVQSETEPVTDAIESPNAPENESDETAHAGDEYAADENAQSENSGLFGGAQ